MCSTPPGRRRAEPALAAPLRSRSAPPQPRRARDSWNERQAIMVGALTRPTLWAGSSLSRNAGEGAERSEAGEGDREARALRPRSLTGAHRVRQAECADGTARRTRHLSAAVSE